MRLRFVGANRSMGLINGMIYSVEIYSRNGYIWVQWKHGRCPYPSLQKLMENWIDCDYGKYN